MRLKEQLWKGSSFLVCVYSMRKCWPNGDKTLSDLSFIDPAIEQKVRIVQLCNRFMTTNSQIDAVVGEYRAFCVAPDHQLPSYDPKSPNGLDHFWSAMSSQKTVASDLELPSSFTYSNLVCLAKILLVLRHSNVEPECLFSMVGKIKSCSLLSSSTTCDLLTVKMNHDAPCFLSQDLITGDLLLESK